MGGSRLLASAIICMLVKMTYILCMPTRFAKLGTAVDAQ